MKKSKAVKTNKLYITKALSVLLTAVLLCQCLLISSSAAITVQKAANADNLIAAGDFHSLALKSDGTVAAWGLNDDGQRTVPSGLSDVVAIAAGCYHSLALKSDGTVAAWGYNEYGQIRVPSGLSDVVAISGGVAYSLALKSDGTVAAWGRDNHDQSTVPSGLADVVAISAGGYHSLALKSDGTVVAWGSNSFGGPSTVPAGLSGVVAISAGCYHSLALKWDGTVVAWGYDKYGQSTVPAGLSGVVAISAGYLHSMALKSDGSVVAWGNNDAGQRTVPSGLSGVVAIAAGRDHSLALKSDGTVVAWGYNGYGQIRVPSGLNLSENYLNGLLVSGGTLSPQFDPDSFSYTLEVPNTVTNIDISPFADSDYQIEVQDAEKASGSTTTVPLNIGENTITIEVIDPAIVFPHTYTITATRETADSTNANLYKLETGTGVLSPAFDSSATEYTVNVDYGISAIDITALPEDMNATTTIGGQSVGSGEQTVSVSLDAGENVISIEVRAGDNQTTKEYTITVTRGLSDNADLSALSVGTGSLDPVFDTDTVAYSVQTADALSSIEVTAVTAEAGSSMKIGGQPAQSNTPLTVPLDNGANLIPIVITAPDGTTQKSYIISVNGTVSNADLGSLSLSEGALSFDAATTDYYVTVGSDVTSIVLTASADDSKAVMLLDGAILSQDGTESLPLSVGDNTAQLMVIAQDATTKTYTVTINRGTSDATLSGLSLSGVSLSPSFNRTTYAYTATVANAVTSLTASPTAFDNASTVTVNGADATTPVSLTVGTNTITVKVTGSDGVTTKSYAITVTRQAEITITNASLPVSIVGGAYSVTMAAEGGDGSFVWSSTGLPSTFSLDSATGVLSGTPVDGDERTYDVTITATDGNTVAGDKSYTLVIHKGCGNGAYLIASDGNTAYTGSYTDEGIPTLTVNEGVSGFTYFRVNILAVTGHMGEEVCVFVHMRNGVQIGFSFNEADYDTVSRAGAGFNVQAGDVVEVYIVDALTNGLSDNPNVL